jgi:acyl-CoA synthetase (NDP forming)
MAADGAAAPHHRFASLTSLFAPRSVAIVGASDDPVRIGGRPIAYMKAQGFAGPILPVNPKRQTVQDLPAFASVDALPEAPDVAIVAVPGDAAIEAVEALGRRGTRGAIVFTAGFAEVDAAGEAAQERLVAAARKHGMRLIGPNCLGLFNARIGFYPIFSSSFENGWPRPGRIGIVSQSGAFGTHIFAAARERHMGTPLLVTTGNEGDVTIGDALGWMVEDPDTDVIAAYCEGVREADSFLAALEAARRARKPVVMMKVGHSALGASAARSHTASIAGDDAVTGAVLAEHGVVRARSTEELLDIAYTATKRIYPVNNTLGVVTISGGAGVLISDVAEAIGLPMPEMPASSQAKLKALIPFSNPRNPVDCTAQAFNDMSLIGAFGREMVEAGSYASVLAFFTQVGASRSIAPAMRRELKAVMAAHPDRLFVLSVLAPPELIREYEADGFLCFEDPTRATVAIAAMGRFGEAFARPGAAPPPAMLRVALPAATPSEAEAKRILAGAGIPAAPERACATADEAVAAAKAMGGRVVMKILSPDILHKSEIGGVLVGIEDADAVRTGFTTLIDRARAHAPAARIEGVLVAKQVSGVECILGIHRDPVFGPVAMVGLGGVFVEILKDVAFRRCPFDAAAAEQMIRALRGFPLLDGARGRPRADVPALADALARLSAFAAAHPEAASVDINPVFVQKAGDGVFAADAVIEIA